MKKQLLILSVSLLGVNTFGQVPYYVPTSGLVGWWPFNGNANDESGNGNNGTVNGATLTTDRFGNTNSTYSFDGLGNSINFNSIFIFNTIGNGTLTFWVSNNQFSSDGYSTLFWSKLQQDDNNRFNIYIQPETLNSNNYRLVADYRDQNLTQHPLNETSLTTFNNSTWYNVALVRNGNQYSLYINGVLYNSIQDNFPSLPTSIGWLLGKGASGNYNFKGELDDIGIWNRALTYCEIQDLYHAQLNSVAVNAGQDQTLCNGQSTTLNGSGASTYSWNNSVQNGVSFVPTATSSYTVIGTDANGCIGTDTVSIVVNNNSTSTLNETALDSYTLNGQTYTQSGIYTQVIPNSAGCDSTITLNLSLNFTGLNELESTMTVSPNPTMDFVNITSTEAIYDEYVLFDPQGRKVLSGKLNGTTTQIDLSQLARGNYLLQIGEKKTPIKLIKE
jgi:hypothetical protein